MEGKSYQTGNTQVATLWKVCSVLKLLKPIIQCYDQTSIFKLTEDPQEILNGIASLWFTWRKKERFQKRREFLFMCWLNKVQVNDMEKQFWKSSIYQHYCIRDVMRLPINGVSHYFSLSTNLFNNHICSYERKYCCFIKPLNSANKCFAPILTWKKIRSSGVGDIQSHWRETCYYYDQWSANAGLSEEAWFIFVLLDKLLLKSWLILELDGGQRLFEESRNTEWQLCDLREEFCMQMVKGLHCQREWWKLGILN